MTNKIKRGMPGTLIHGTLRFEDLAPAFAAELNRLGTAVTLPDNFNQLSPDEQAEWVDTLIDKLDAHAPEGHYFGAHEGDGADFGFWQYTDL